MIVYPSDDLAKDISNDKLKPAFRLVPKIKKQFYENASKEPRLKFKNMTVYLRGAGSPSKLASKAIKYLFFDEIDKMGGASKKEASPYNLAMERIKTFKSQSKVYACSTPTLKTNYIWSLHDSADEVKEYFVPCPHCGEMSSFFLSRFYFVRMMRRKCRPMREHRQLSIFARRAVARFLIRTSRRCLRGRMAGSQKEGSWQT